MQLSKVYGDLSKLINKLSYYSLFFLSTTALYTQEEYNIKSLIKVDGSYKDIEGEKLPHLVHVFKLEHNKKKFLGKLVNGKKHGTWKEVYSDMRTLVENYKNGNLEGSVSLFYKNGQKEWRYNYANGILNGTYTRWYKNGQKAISGYFESGEPVDIWAWWDQTGKILKKQKYPPKANGITKGHKQYTDKIDIYD